MRLERKDVVTFFVVLILGIIVASQIAIVKVSGNSMSSTYTDGDIIVMRKKKSVEVDDLVIFVPPESWRGPGAATTPFLKRVVASSGDTVSISDDGLYINNSIVRKHRNKCDVDFNHKLVDGEYFALGDNEILSNDAYSQICKGNEDVFIGPDKIIEVGKPLFRIGGRRK